MTAVAAADSSTTPAKPISAGHLRALDGMRGLAILLVVVYHFGLLHVDFTSNAAPPLAQLAQIGWIGVDLFFVLSGFLITGILLDTRERPHYLRNFLARRFLRIWPLYYLNLALFFVVAPLMMAAPPAELQSMQHEQSWFWLYAANWLFAKEGGFGQTSGGYFWSLAVEEQFYLVWPLIVLYASAAGVRRLCVALFAFSVAARFVLVARGVSTNTAYTMTFSHMDGLVVGAYLACALRSPEASAVVDRWLPRCALLGFAGLVCVRLIDGNYLFWSRAMATAGIACAAVVFGWLLWLMARRANTPLLTPLFTSAPLVATGRYSYALYLAHVPVGYVAHAWVERTMGSADRGLHYWMFFALAFTTAWMLAFASWHLFEKHILALKRYF